MTAMRPVDVRVTRSSITALNSVVCMWSAKPRRPESRQDASPDDYQPLWNENVALLKHLENAPEIEKVRQTGDDGMSEEDWKRNKALLEQTMPGHMD